MDEKELKSLHLDRILKQSVFRKFVHEVGMFPE